MKNIQEDIIDKLTPEIIEEMKHIWFIADLHFDHPKIVKICDRQIPLIEGLDISIPAQKRRINELHNDWLIRDVYNKYIDRKDTVYILGDVSMSSKNDTEKIIDKLHGNKFLILGNHDKNIDHSTRFSQITQMKDFNFSRGALNIHIVLCHYALASWNRKIHGSWHLYGHVHGRFANTGLSWDVGIDNKNKMENIDNLYKPINLYDVCQLMNMRQLAGYDKYDSTESAVEFE